MYSSGTSLPTVFRALTLPVSLVFLGAPISSNAHHSFAIYSDEISVVEGELVSVRWGNPHVRFELETPEGASWMLEAAAVYVLERRGLTRDLFQIGDRIQVAGRRHRGPSEQIWLHNLQLGSGQELLMINGVEPRWSNDVLGGDGRLAEENIANQNRSLFRIWSKPVLGPIAYGDDLPYRNARPPGGLEWIARMDGFAERCEPVGMPGIMATPYPFEFIDRGTSIQLLGFSNNALIDRTIRMGGDFEADPPLSDRLGFSVGRWEAPNRLIVETSRIEWPYFDDSMGTPQSEAVQTIEVFTLSEDQRRLDYEMVVIDPATFTERATAIQTYWLALGESRAQSAFCAISGGDNLSPD